MSFPTRVGVDLADFFGRGDFFLDFGGVIGGVGVVLLVLVVLVVLEWNVLLYLD
jgi:hypothetical protein